MMNIKSKVYNLCEDAIKRIDDALEKHSKGEPADLSIPMLNRVKSEVEEMKESLNPSLFKPTYPRFVSDWPDDHGLVGLLTDLAYQYGRIKG